MLIVPGKQGTSLAAWIGDSDSNSFDVNPCCIVFSPSGRVFGLSENSLWTNWGTIKLEPALKMYYMIGTLTTPKWNVVGLLIHSAVTLEINVEEKIFPTSRTLSSKSVVFYVWGRNWSKRWIYGKLIRRQIYGKLIIVWVGSHVLGRNKIRRLVKSKYGKEVYGWAF